MERIEPQFYECVQRNGKVVYRVVLRVIKGQEPYHRETFLYLSGAPIVTADICVCGEETLFESLEIAKSFADRAGKEYLAKLNPYEIIETRWINYSGDLSNGKGK